MHEAEGLVADVLAYVETAEGTELLINDKGGPRSHIHVESISNGSED